MFVTYLCRKFSSGSLSIAIHLKANRAFAEPSYYFPFFKHIIIAKVAFLVRSISMSLLVPQCHFLLTFVRCTSIKVQYNSSHPGAG
jgi:hypothetical protein